MAVKELTDVDRIGKDKFMESDASVFINTGGASPQLKQIKRDDLLSFCTSVLLQAGILYNKLEYSGGQGEMMLDATVGPAITKMIEESKNSAITEAVNQTDDKIKAAIEDALNAEY